MTDHNNDDPSTADSHEAEGRVKTKIASKLPALNGLDPGTDPPASDLDELDFDKQTRLTRRRRGIVFFSLALAFGLWFMPPTWKLVYGPVVVTRYDRKAGETKATVGPGAKGWTPIKKISRHTLFAIVAAEDGKFYDHHGFDFGEILSSIETNMKKRRYARGGSTLSQQVVKMAFLDREKSLIRKAREALGTVVMESMLSKDQILEWYVNLAEFGDNVYGVEEGAWHYFKTKPELLSIDQSVHLALVLPSPNAWSRGLRARKLTPFGHRRFASILNRMKQAGFITKTQWETAVTRGDFGRPITGYASLLAAADDQKLLCPGNPGCPESDGDDVDADEDPVLSSEGLTPRSPPLPAPSSQTSPGTTAAASGEAASAEGGSPSPTFEPSPELVFPSPPQPPAETPSQPPAETPSQPPSESSTP